MLEGIKIYKTDREFSLKALEKYTRNRDQKVLAALWEEFGNGVIQKSRTPTRPGPNSFWMKLRRADRKPRK